MCFLFDYTGKQVLVLEWKDIQARLEQLVNTNRHGELRGAMSVLNPVDIAQFMESLDPEKLLMAFRILPKDISADVFSYMTPETQKVLLNSIGDKQICSLINDMFLDDAVDFLDELPSSVVTRVLQNTDVETRNLINHFLDYPENSAGSIMTIEYMSVQLGMTVRQTMDEIKRVGFDKETIYTLYVIDAKRHLIGSFALRKLILAQDDDLVENIMDSSVISVGTTDDQEKVASLVRRYDLLAIPVVDKENRLVGIVTADDIMDVIQQENTEDFEKMAALTPSEESYIHTSPFKLAWNRIPWLLLLSIAAIFTGMIITQYETLLQTASVVLTACIPMLMDTGGNCGAQVSTLIIRGLALNEIQFRDIFRILWKEFRVGLMVGAVLSVFTFLRVMFINKADYATSLVVALSLYSTVLLAKAIGCCLPLLAKRLKLDPALMASPLITTIVDAASLTVYFTIATKLLHL